MRSASSKYFDRDSRRENLCPSECGGSCAFIRGGLLLQGSGAETMQSPQQIASGWWIRPLHSRVSDNAIPALGTARS